MRILLVEDEADLREAWCRLLNLQGFTAAGVGSIASYRAWSAAHTCDALIVDRVLPDGDGLEVVRLHRLTSQAPLVVVSALGEVRDRVAGLDADADHYLVKPVAFDELLAVLRGIGRRLGRPVAPAPCWLVDRIRWTLQVPGGPQVPLTRREVDFLGALAGRSGETVRRDSLIRALGEEPLVYDPRRLEVMVRRLRNKVEAAGVAGFPLTTVYGQGYAFNAPLKEA